VRPRLLLVPPFTEVQWMIRPELEEWAEVGAYDPPGVGEEPLPAGLTLDPEMPDDERREALRRWREAGAERGLAEVDHLGWDRFFVVMDGEGIPTGVRIARMRPDAVQGLAIGHAALARTTEGERPAVNKEVMAAMGELLRTDTESFIRYGITQATAGSVPEEVATQMVERFPNSEIVIRVWELLGSEPEPIEDDLVALGKPLLLAEHVGCLGSTPEGFEDIVNRFPEAITVSCPEACSVSPAFVEALREFCSVST
jgi:pimeloyl-ACP methyl ester carboxylesterase